MIALGVLLWSVTHHAKPREKPDEMVLYCATGLLKPVQEACEQYQKEHGVKVHIEPDNSGSLLAGTASPPSASPSIWRARNRSWTSAGGRD